MTVLRRHAALAVAAALLVLAAAPASADSTSATTTWTHRDAHVCVPTPDGAGCTSIARTLYANGIEYHAATPAQLQAAARAAASVSYTAVGIRTAYGITGQGDPSRVIAIVDAYDDTAAYSNLATYRSGMGLPAIQSCPLSTLTTLTSTAASPCFTKVNQTGGTSLPAANSGWANEIDLDLQAASAICPKCSLLLLEANSTGFGDLGTAVTTAAGTPHVLAISNSYGTTSDVPQSSYPAWNRAAQQGIAVMAASGDWGYAISFPASSTDVIGVGGTTLSVDSSGVRSGETVWSSAGSGCSTYNAAPSWQLIPGSPCGSLKAVADLSADANPNSGLQIYTTYNGTTGWWIFGGTSLSSPLMAALCAMQGAYSSPTLASQYAWASTTPYFDVTSGSNGTCSPSVMCTAGTGWDGPSGRGSIASATASQTLTSVTVSPASASVTTGATQQFTATGYDQNNNPMSPQPSFTWAVNGGGTISSTGLFTAGSSAGGPFTVTASSSGVNGTASVTVTAPATAGFTISASPSSRSIKRGQSTSYSISITRTGGFTGSIALSVSSHPGGITGTFSPNPATGTSSTLTIPTSKQTTAGTYQLTITGSYGSILASSTTVKLTLR